MENIKNFKQFNEGLFDMFKNKPTEQKYPDDDLLDEIYKKIYEDIEQNPDNDNCKPGERSKDFGHIWYPYSYTIGDDVVVADGVSVIYNGKKLNVSQKKAHYFYHKLWTLKSESVEQFLRKCKPGEDIRKNDFETSNYEEWVEESNSNVVKEKDGYVYLKSSENWVRNHGFHIGDKVKYIGRSWDKIKTGEIYRIWMFACDHSDELLIRVEGNHNWYKYQRFEKVNDFEDSNFEEWVDE